MRRVHETIVALDKQQVLRISLCVCAHAPCCIVICALSGSTIFFDIYLINGTNLGKTFFFLSGIYNPL